MELSFRRRSRSLPSTTTFCWCGCSIAAQVSDRCKSMSAGQGLHAWSSVAVATMCLHSIWVVLRWL